MRPPSTTIDPDRDRADQDAAATILDSPDRVLWIVYKALRNARGFSSDRADFEIAKLAPRKVAA